MNNEAMWATLIGALLPPVIAVLQQPKWTAQTRAIATAVICVLVGLGTAYFNGQLASAKDTTECILLVLIAALATYRSFWKPVGVTGAIERATSPKVGPGE